MNAIFMEWVDSLVDELPDGDGIHVDGKCLRRALTKDGLGSPAAKRLSIQQPASSSQQNAGGIVR